MRHYVAHADSLRRVRVDVGDGLLHETSGVRHGRRGFPCDDLRTGARLAPHMLRAVRFHHFAQHFGGTPADGCMIRLCARKGGNRVFAEHRIVVHSNNGNLVRHGKPRGAARLQHVKRTVVECGEHTAGLWQRPQPSRQFGEVV